MQPQDSAPPPPSLPVLVVDDDVALSATLTSILRSAGYVVDVAYDGAEGLEHVKAARPAIVILDVNLPVMDGYEFIDAFRRIPGCADVPIILSTAAADVVQVRRRIEGKGTVLLMPKPFDIETLMRALTGVSRIRRS